MKAIVMLLALASSVSAVTIYEVSWISITSDGGLGYTSGNVSLNVGPKGCIFGGNTPDVSYWMYSTGIEDSDGYLTFSTLEETKVENAVCGLFRNVDENNPRPGLYFPVLEWGTGDEAKGYTSEQYLQIPGDPFGGQWADEAEDETAVEAVTWGSIKSGATRRPGALTKRRH